MEAENENENEKRVNQRHKKKKNLKIRWVCPGNFSTKIVVKISCCYLLVIRFLLSADYPKVSTHLFTNMLIQPFKTKDLLYNIEHHIRLL